MQEKTLPKPKIRTSNIHSMDFGAIFYDIFGSPYQKSGCILADDSLDFGYLGKPYNADSELYDYGFRYYSPEIPRFTTVDPIRDGRNWFCYVVNDPVNYVDLWGLCTGDKKSSVWDNFTGSGNPYENYGVSTFLPALDNKINKKSTKYINDFRCDMYAWNSAVEDEKNPKGQKNQDWNIDLESVGDIYNFFPNLRFSSPQNNTAGFAFYFTSDSKDIPIHIEYYTNLDDDPTT